MEIEIRKDSVRQRFASGRTAILFSTVVTCLLVFMFGATILSAAPPPGQGPGEPQRWVDQLPQGEGRDIVAANCVLCHTVERIVTSHRPRVAWETLVKVMADRGCPLNDDQVSTVIDYVSKNFGPVPRNAEATPSTNSSHDNESTAGAPKK
jgi:hypothetical protein